MKNKTNSEKRIYLAGKIGTYDFNKVSKDCIRKFQIAEMELKKMFPGCLVFNPLEYAQDIAGKEIIFEYVKTPFENLTARQRARYLKNNNIRVLTDSTAIYLLTDWRSSAGALFEKEVADFLGLEIIYQKENN